MKSKTLGLDSLISSGLLKKGEKIKVINVKDLEKSELLKLKEIRKPVLLSPKRELNKK